MRAVKRWESNRFSSVARCLLSASCSDAELCLCWARIGPVGSTESDWPAPQSSGRGAAILHTQQVVVVAPC